LPVPVRKTSLWGWLAPHERKGWPTLVRGDIACGNEEMLAGCEQRGLVYLLQPRQAGRWPARLRLEGDRVAWWGRCGEG
jgi:hypothetical protein